MDRYDPYTDKFLRDTQYDILSTNLAEVGTDCIGRQALLDKFEPWLKVKDYNDGELNMLKAVLYEIRFMSPAQPGRDTPKRVMWTGWKGHRYTRYNCPNCKKPVRNDDVYCHRCGQRLMFPKVSHTPYVEGQKQEVIVIWEDEVTE